MARSICLDASCFHGTSCFWKQLETVFLTRARVLVDENVETTTLSYLILSLFESVSCFWKQLPSVETTYIGNVTDVRCFHNVQTLYARRRKSCHY